MSNFYTGKNVTESINNISTSNDNSKELKIIPPEGYEIDRENSTFECIKFKPKHERWRDEEYAKICGYFINVDASIIPVSQRSNIDVNHNIFATEKQAKSALAMAQISQIMANDERFGGTITDEEWGNHGMTKWTIERSENKIVTTFRYGTYMFLAFHTMGQRALFLKENEDLVKDYLMF